MENKDTSEKANAAIINLENDYELQYWTSQLKVTNDELREAVKKAGNDIEAIKVYLNKA